MECVHGGHVGGAKSYSHKNKTFFPNGKEFYCFLPQHGRSEHILLIPHAKGLILTVTLSTQECPLMICWQIV